MKISLTGIRVLLIPLAFLFAAIALLVFGGRFVWQRVSSARSQLARARATETVLREKVAMLEVSQVTLGASSTQLAAALPENNSSLLVSSQVKGLAADFGLDISELRLGGAGETQGLSRAEVKFDVDGRIDVVSNFLRALPRTSPVTRFEAIDIIESGEIVRASVTLSAYWSAFPSQLPPVEQKLEGLTAAEEELVSEISQFRQPEFVSLSPSVPVSRSNPFSL